MTGGGRHCEDEGRSSLLCMERLLPRMHGTSSRRSSSSQRRKAVSYAIDVFHKVIEINTNTSVILIFLKTI